MHPEILKNLLKTLGKSSLSISEIKNKGDFCDEKALRNWLNQLIYAGLIEKIDSNDVGLRNQPIRVKYRIKNLP